jgi:putative nucleotidyltransferase-like protein
VTLVPRSLWPVLNGLATQTSWPPRNAAEAVTFIELAETEGLLPLLFEQPDLPAAISDVLPQFRALDALHKLKYDLSRTALLELIRIVGADAFVLLKGSDYRFRLYSKPHLRPLNDIDFFVPRGDVNRVIAAMSAAGSGQLFSKHGAQWSSGYYEYKCVIANMHFELHRSFMTPIRARVPYDAIWQRREAFDGDGYRAFRLAHNDALLHHAVSMARDEFWVRLLRYVDMALFLRHPSSDLRECVERAREWGTERALYSSLRLTLRVFPELGDAVVENAMSSLLTERRRAFLDRRVLPDPRSEPSGRSPGRVRQLWRKFWLMDRVWRRAAFFATHAWESASGRVRERFAGRLV